MKYIIQGLFSLVGMCYGLLIMSGFMIDEYNYNLVGKSIIYLTIGAFVLSFVCLYLIMGEQE
jgi:hypothetical protein